MRHHVIGQPFLHETSQFTHAQLCLGLADKVSDQTFISIGKVGSRHYENLFYRGVLAKPCRNPAKLDREAAYLYLLMKPAQELNASIGPETPLITTTIHPG